MPRALTIEEIGLMVGTFGDGALRARRAGFDAVEVIASVSYIISQFLSPLTNKRTDKYGGSLENRMRFLFEIIDNVQRKAGSDFPITCRLSGADLMKPKGYDLEDTKRMARVLEDAGICQIDVMSGWHHASVPIIQTWVPQGEWVYMAEGVKTVVNIPVAAGTQIQDPLVAERILEQGKADMVYMARALVADPELPNKAREGQLKEIRPCINCCRCISAVDNPPVYCTVNARVGREPEYSIEEPAKKHKTVLVVGGGPGGMEVARVASLRGHKVTLCDSNRRLGGALLLASITNSKLVALLRYMEREIRKLPIEVKLNTRVTRSVIDDVKPDVMVLAAGGSARRLGVQGEDTGVMLDRSYVQSILGGHYSDKGGLKMKALSFFAGLFIRYFYNPSLIRWLLRFRFPFGRRVLIVGGDFAGCELADMLVGLGKKVTLVEESNRFGSDIELTHRWVFMDRLKKAGVRMIKESKIAGISSRGVTVSQAGAHVFIEADTVAVAGIRENTEIARELKGQVTEVYSVGDCAEPGNVMEAVASGFITGHKI